ncbi:hypothetical protein GH714_004989 [Hevea brasiliensis]|uniref:Leucine-rich repeat-containing N-terminal plant-type domain-containing protein n=1 Tax=Hevea brasiliensis TaxID=3981 RepID=A0A6A6KIQ7_HEVBR|nr:hypothetical protein GH714_004989 [Hevea brasiliensis]
MDLLYGLESWNSTSDDCCQWKYVACDYLQKVTALDLSNITFFQPFKTLVTSDVLTPLFRLQTLSSLHICKIDIHGEISGVGFANLTNLVELFMNENSFNGSIPPQLFSLRHLERLDLSEIPFWLSTQTFLLYLDLSENNLEGNFPKWLAESDISYLILSSNKLSGSLPSRLFQFQRLYILILSSNNFSGPLPDTIGEATGMRILMLSNNNFSGSLPASISNMLKLELLDLSSNQFSSNEFPIFNPNSSLVYADFSFNKFFGNVPVTFPLTTEVILLSHNHFSGFLPQCLTNFSRMKYLDFHDNNIIGEIPVFLTEISSLHILNRRNNFLNGSIPINLSSLSAPQILDLSINNLDGKIPPSLGNLTGMINDHDDSSSSIFSQIPFPSFWLQENRKLNDFKGSWKLHDLEVFWKKLKQGLPSQHLQMYICLDLSSNQLSGEIPDCLGVMKNLKSFNLSNNKLSGKIPMSFGDLQSLESLDLSHNNLNGEIPQTLAKLLQLSYLDLSNNKLVGHIPSGPQMDRLNDPNSYTNNSGLCGLQIQIPCESEKFTPKTKQKQGKPKKRKSWETWFSWEMAVIGYSSGFFSTILVMYVIGYFNAAPLQGRRRHIIHNTFFFNL